MDMFGNVFVRDTPYVMVTHARVFAMLPKDQRFGRLSLLYISALLSYCRLLYSFSSMATWRGVKDDYISLPVTEEGEIDFAYMENFIREIEASRLYKLDAYLQAAGFASSALTAEEAEALRQMECKQLRMGSFRAKELFFVRSNPQLDKESFVFSPSAPYPYFTRTVNNNGFLGYVEYLDEAHKIAGGSLAVGMLGMQFFYMERDFYAGQFTKTVFPKFDGFDAEVALYFASLFNKARAQFLKGLVRDFVRLFSEHEITIPVDIAGKPDLPTIRAYIRATMKRAIHHLVAWKDCEIAATQQICAAPPPQEA